MDHKCNKSSSAFLNPNYSATRLRNADLVDSVKIALEMGNSWMINIGFFNLKCCLPFAVATKLHFVSEIFLHPTFCPPKNLWVLGFSFVPVQFSLADLDSDYPGPNHLQSNHVKSFIEESCLAWVILLDQEYGPRAKCSFLIDTRFRWMNSYQFRRPFKRCFSPPRDLKFAPLG